MKGIDWGGYFSCSDEYEPRIEPYCKNHFCVIGYDSRTVKRCDERDPQYIKTIYYNVTQDYTLFNYKNITINEKKYELTSFGYFMMIILFLTIFVIIIVYMFWCYHKLNNHVEYDRMSPETTAI